LAQRLFFLLVIASPVFKSSSVPCRAPTVVPGFSFDLLGTAVALSHFDGNKHLNRLASTACKLCDFVHTELGCVRTGKRLRELSCLEKAMMTSELRYLLKTNSNCEGFSDQESLRLLLADLREVANDLELDFCKANVDAETLNEARDWLQFDPAI
jgi:hypothetical protein